MVKSDKLLNLETQIEVLQVKKKKLENKRKNLIATILVRCDALSLPDEILAGAVLGAVRCFRAGDPCLKTWHADGEKILRPGRGKKKIV